MALFGPLLETLLQTSLIAADPIIGHNNKMMKDRALQWKARAEEGGIRGKEGSYKIQSIYNFEVCRRIEVSYCTWGPLRPLNFIKTLHAATTRRLTFLVWRLHLI
jgi:hypothetical protein